MFTDASDIAALLDVYHATNGPQWKSTASKATFMPWNLKKSPGKWDRVKWENGRVV